MIELVMTICSILHGAQCREERLPFLAERVSVIECALYGQIEMARWQAGHPNWSVARWRCQPAGLQAKA